MKEKRQTGRQERGNTEAAHWEKNTARDKDRNRAWAKGEATEEVFEEKQRKSL